MTERRSGGGGGGGACAGDQIDPNGDDQLAGPPDPPAPRDDDCTTSSSSNNADDPNTRGGGDAERSEVGPENVLGTVETEEGRPIGEMMPVGRGVGLLRPSGGCASAGGGPIGANPFWRGDGPPFDEASGIEVDGRGGGGPMGARASTGET